MTDILDAIEAAARTHPHWPFQMSVGPVHDTGVAQEGAAWVWWVKDAEGAGISGIATTEKQAEAARVAEIEDWWEVVPSGQEDR